MRRLLISRLGELCATRTRSTAAAKSAIPTRRCGKGGGFEVPEVGVGCWSFGCGEGEYWGRRDQEDVNDVCLAALEYGSAFFDTAEVYQAGRSEESLAAALSAAPPALSGKAVIATKIQPQNCGDVRSYLDASLKRLKRDSVYLYQVHWPINNQTCGSGPIPDVGAVFKELAALQSEGKIEHIGVSNFGVKQLREALATGARIATNQLMYNLVSRAIEYEVMPICQQNDIGVICYSPLLQGLLTDKSAGKAFDELDVNRTRTRHFDGKRQKSRHGGPGCEAEMRAALDRVAAVARREGRSVSDLAMAWCLADPRVVSIIPGAASRAQLEANMGACRRPLSAEVKRELDEATEAVKAALGDKIDYYVGDDDQRSF